MPDLRCDVLVVGCGLSGLTLATQLCASNRCSGRKVTVCVVDKRCGMADRFRVVGGGGLMVTPANLLWAHQVGVAEDLVAARGARLMADLEHVARLDLLRNGRRVQGDAGEEAEDTRDAQGLTTAKMSRMLFAKKDYEDAACSYLNIDQRTLEEVLLRHLLKDRDVKILWQHELVAMASDDTSEGGHIAELQGDGREMGISSVSVKCRFVVGCDGRQSNVRKLHFEGEKNRSTSPASDESFQWREHKGVMLHMLCDGQLDWDLPRMPYRLEQKSLNGLGPVVGGGAIIPLPSVEENLFRVSVNAPFTMWGSNVECLDSPNLSLLQKQLKPKLPRGAKIESAKWSKYYRMNHFLASTFSDGTVFLVGEAAHAHPPLGIQPMNASMQNAVNLGWKLELAVKLNVKDPQSRLLSSYHAEQKPAAEKVYQHISGYFSDLIQGNLKPIRSAFSDCQLFDCYAESPDVLMFSSEDAGRYVARCGEIAPNVENLLVTNTMKHLSLQDILLSSSKHKIFFVSSSWSQTQASPGDFSVTSDTDEERQPLPSFSWGNLQRSVEGTLGTEFLKFCELYVMHSSPTISHEDGVDFQLACEATHLVDEQSAMGRKFFCSSECAAGVLIRPDMRIGALGEFPDFLDLVREYKNSIVPQEL